MSNTTASAQELPVLGAFEDFQEKPEDAVVHEQLITLTRNGRLLQPGDKLPIVPGIDGQTSPYLVHVVNMIGTPTCDGCVDTLETLRQEYPNIPVFTVTKEFDSEDAKNRAHALGQKVLQIDHEVAVDLGVGIAPGEDAAEDFWPNALRRSLIAVDADGAILDVQQPDDQEAELNFLQAYEAVLNTQQSE